MNKRKKEYIVKYNEESKKIVLHKPDTAKQKVELMLRLMKEVPTKLKYETVEICFHLNNDPKKTDQNIKTSAALKNGWVSKKTIGLFTNEEVELSAYKNITCGGAKLIDDIKTNKKHSFNVCVAHTSLEKSMNSIAKVLQKTSPNKKYGTLTDNCVDIAIKIATNKLVLISNEKNMLHTPIGTSEMNAVEILENIMNIVDVINANKPIKLKTAMIKLMKITTTQSHKSIIITPRELALYDASLKESK